MANGVGGALRLVVISIAVLLAGCSRTKATTPTPSVEVHAIVTKPHTLLPSPSPTSTPEPTSTPDDGLTENQRTLLQNLGLYEDFRDLPADSSLRESALGLIEALWPAEGDQMITIESALFESADFDPGLLANVFNREQYYVRVIAENGSMDEEDSLQLPLGTLILWSDQIDELTSQDSLLVYKPQPGEELQFTIMQPDDEIKYRALISIKRDSGVSNAYTDPTGEYWIEPIYHNDIVILGNDEVSTFYWRRVVGRDDEQGKIYWNETGELLPEFPGEVEELKLYSEDNIEGEKEAYLASVTDVGEVKKEYKLATTEDGDNAWTNFSEVEFQTYTEKILEGLENQGYEVTLNSEEGATEIMVSKEDRNGNMQTYNFGELRTNEEGKTVFSIGEIRGEEKVFPIDRLDIGEYTIERLTEDGGREEFVKQKTRILTSDSRPYYQFMPEDPRLVNTEWGQAGEEFLKITATTEEGEIVETDVAVEYYDEQGRLRLKIGVGESFAGEYGEYRWNEKIPDFEYEDPETGEVRMLSPAERYAEAYYTALWLNGAFNGHNDGLTISQIRDGTSVNFEGKDSEIHYIDSSQTFTHLRTRGSYVRSGRYPISTSILGSMWLDIDDGKPTLTMLHNFDSPYIDEKNELPVLLYNISLIDLSVPQVWQGRPVSTTSTYYPYRHPDPSAVREYMYRVSTLIFQLKDNAIFADSNLIRKRGTENMLISVD